MGAYFRGGLFIDSTVISIAISNCVCKYIRATFILSPTTLSKITRENKTKNFEKSFVTRRKNISRGAYPKHCYYSNILYNHNHLKEILFCTDFQRTCQ